MSALRVALAALVWLSLAPCVLQAQPRPMAGGPVVSATPNPVPTRGETGVTTIRWDVGSGSNGRIVVSVDGGPPTLFASGVRGAQNASWIRAGAVYEFTLYRGEDPSRPLASVRVTGRAGGAGWPFLWPVLLVLVTVGAFVGANLGDMRRESAGIRDATDRLAEVAPTAFVLAALVMKCLYANLTIDASLRLWTLATATLSSILLLVAALSGIGWRRFGAALAIDIAVTLLLVIDLVHMRFFGEPASFAELQYAWQLWSVAPAVASKLQAVDLALFADVPLAAIGYAFHRRRHAASAGHSLKRWRWSAAFGVAGLVVLVPTANVLYNDPDHQFEWRSRGDIVGLTGFLPYHLYDIGAYAAGEWGRRHVGEAEKSLVDRHISAQREMLRQRSPLFGIAARSNLIVIQEESLQAFTLGLHLNGQAVTPNLDAFAGESLQFVNFHDQTWGGMTSDSVFVSLQSLYPLAPGAGAIATRYPSNQYRGLPAVLADVGYSTLAAMGAPGKYWNIDGLEQKLGFERMYFSNDFPSGERFGQGVADGDFFKQATPLLVSARPPFMAFLITVSNHSPYDLPGDHRRLNVGRLADTYVGKYLESVHYLDEAFGTFIAELRRTGLLDKTVIAVYGDHQGWLATAPELATVLNFDAADQYEYWKVRKRVPLLIRLPFGREAGVRTVNGGHLDTAPTLLSLLGVDPGRTVMLGADLTKASASPVIFRDGSFAQRDHYSIEPPQLGPNRVCYAIESHVAADCGPTRDREQAFERLRVSDLIIQGNLVPALTSSSQLTSSHP